MFKKYLSQQGLTLVELLVALVIASFIIGLVTSVLLSTVKFNDNTQTRINLRQESNRIVTEIRASHQKDGNVCYDQLTANSGIEMTMQLNNSVLQNGDCFAVRHTNDLPVKFTLSDGSKNSFTIDTVVEGTKGTDLSFTIPKKDAGFIDNLKLDNVLFYGSNLHITGSAGLGNDVNQSGTVVVNNLNKANLVLSGGGSNVIVENIYINKKGNEVIFADSTKFGDEYKKLFPKIVHITGNVQFDNGGARIFGDAVYIDGNATFSNSAVIEGKKVIINGNVLLNNGAAKINGDTIYINGDVTFGNSALLQGKKIYINGNVTFKNASAKIKADEIYIAGTVKKHSSTSTHLEGNQKNFIEPSNDVRTIPKSPTFNPPSLHADNWYSKNGYKVQRNEDFSTGDRIFSPGNFKVDNWHSNKHDVVIISKGDIEINSFDHMSGILFAPYGKVIIKGATFNGVIIARDGLSTRGDTKITFTNVSQFIKEKDPIPFE